MECLVKDLSLNFSSSLLSSFLALILFKTSFIVGTNKYLALAVPLVNPLPAKPPKTLYTGKVVWTPSTSTIKLPFNLFVYVLTIEFTTLSTPILLFLYTQIAKDKNHKPVSNLVTCNGVKPEAVVWPVLPIKSLTVV